MSNVHLESDNKSRGKITGENHSPLAGCLVRSIATCYICGHKRTNMNNIDISLLSKIN